MDGFSPSGGGVGGVSAGKGSDRPGCGSWAQWWGPLLPANGKVESSAPPAGGATGLMVRPQRSEGGALVSV